jgi:hypothetical protein
LEDALKNAGKKQRSSPKRSRGGMGINRKWERSQERLLRVTRDGKCLDDDLDEQHADGAVHDQDEDDDDGGSESPLLGVGEEAEDQVWNAGETASWGKRRAARSLRQAADTTTTSHNTTIQEDKQWGVVKMELMARTWGKKGLFTIYAGLVSVDSLHLSNCS